GRRAASICYLRSPGGDTGIDDRRHPFGGDDDRVLGTHGAFCLRAGGFHQTLEAQPDFGPGKRLLGANIGVFVGRSRLHQRDLCDAHRADEQYYPDTKSPDVPLLRGSPWNIPAGPTDPPGELSRRRARGGGGVCGDYRSAVAPTISQWTGRRRASASVGDRRDFLARGYFEFLLCCNRSHFDGGDRVWCQLVPSPAAARTVGWLDT